MILLALLAGCGGPGTTSQTDWVIDCVGMEFHDTSGILQSETPIYAEVEGAAFVPRCRMWTSQSMSVGTELPIVTGATPHDTTDVTNMFVAIDGTEYVARSGTITFDTFEWSKASGTYELVGRPEIGPGTEDITVSGAFSWCWDLARDDCATRLDEGQLHREYVLDLPYFAEQNGFVAGCRMLVDPTTSALRVDLEVGTWSGTNVAQLWVNECDTYGDPLPNLLTFRAGGVTGSGSYGPQVVSDVGDDQLPDVVFTHPMTFLGGLNDTSACNMFRQSATASSTLGGTCTFEVDAEAERFVLDCTEVRHASPPNTIVTFDTTGELHLETQCTYVEQPS